MMKFEEAMQQLRNGEVVTRDSWKVEKRIKLENGKLALTYSDFKIDKSEEWKAENEDLFAEDWKVVEKDSIKEFHLSANDLREYGVADEVIEELRKKNFPFALHELSKLKSNEDVLKLIEEGKLGIKNFIGNMEFTTPNIAILKNK